LRGEHLTPLEFRRERIESRRRTHMQTLDDWLACPEVQRCRDDRDRNKRESNGARDGRKVEQTAAHQWNICALPAW
jgi:hypothetical protein